MWLELSVMTFLLKNKKYERRKTNEHPLLL